MTPYDAIRYPGLPYADTHPDRLAAVATFHGMAPASPEHCRVLEVGCGDGGNLVPIAYGLPSSTFVGIDLARGAIETARAFAQRAGVSNATFEPLDLTQFPQDSGAFDYIIAHGVYSWIPPDVRDAMIALIGRHLAPQGVAFVSYNTYPGCYERRMMWEMLKFHTAELADPEARLTEAQALVHLVAHGNAQLDDYTRPLVTEAQHMEERLPALLFHDDLSPTNDPVYFHEFVEHSARHGLQYLAEAAFVTSSYAGIAPKARSALAALDPITRQQYLDFIKSRRFRETLLCRSEVALDRQETPQRMRGLSFSAGRRVRAAPQDVSMPPGAVETPGPVPDGEAETAVLRALLEILRAAEPGALPFDAMFDELRARMEREQLPAKPNDDLEAFILASLQAGVIVPHVISPRLAWPPGDSPTASAVVRAQLVDGDVVASLWHNPVKVDDEISKRLLPLLDGTRTRSELLAAMGDVATPTNASGPAALDEHLDRLAKLALLVA